MKTHFNYLKKFQFWFYSIFIENKYSIFNNFCTIDLNIPKSHHWKAFQQYQEHNEGHLISWIQCYSQLYFKKWGVWNTLIQYHLVMIKGGEMLIFSRKKKIKIVIEFQHYILNRFVFTLSLTKYSNSKSKPTR